MKKIVLITILLFHTQLSALSVPPEELSAHIEVGLETQLQGQFTKHVQQLYESNGYTPLWLKGDRQLQLLTALDDPLFNYKRKAFGQKNIRDLIERINNGSIQQNNMAGALARLDILLSHNFIKLVHFISVGDVDWTLVKKKLESLKVTQDVHAAWELTPKKLPQSKAISAAIQQGNIRSYLILLLPQIEQYRSLVALLDKYRNMPELPKIGFGSLLKPHSMNARVRKIKKVLRFTGDFPRESTNGSGYGRDLSNAIKSFKERFNLTRGDYIDNKVIVHLNTSKYKYIKTILINLDRLKLYPHRFSENHIKVNIPDYQLRYFQKGVQQFQSPIIVGRIDRPTPLFSSKIKYMVLNPTWTITDNLVRHDLIPVLKKDPNYLKDHDIHVFTSYKKDAKEVTPNLEKLFKYEKSKRAIPYRFVQFPGSHNALGRVKFMFPNKYSVYLHDTDNRSLFKYRYRLYSSGCVRVQRPFDFMYALLKYAARDYSHAKVEKIFASNKPTTIRLKKHIPVHMLYQTVYNQGGRDYFLYDVYMYDQIIWESTAGRTKATFVVPQERLTTIKREGARIREKR